MHGAEGLTSERVVVGMGPTGLSLARHLAACGLHFAATDSREEPPCAAAFREEFPTAELHAGGFDATLLAGATEIFLSPGVDPAIPPLVAARERGARLLGDIELFWRSARAPVVAITGTNAKSTVTTLVGMMATTAGLRAPCGGNLGTPALELLDDAAELYVLELSSFQLDLVHDFRADVAAILNIAPDHLDRYADMAAYANSKQRIFRGSRVSICNREDARTRPAIPAACVRSFGLDSADEGDYGLVLRDGVEYLACGAQALLPVPEMALLGRHNVANALAAIAIADAAGIPREAQFEVLRSYRGLPHRCQRIASIDGVDFFDDSKGTNVAAVVAALQGLAPNGEGRVVLIAGGIAKETDFSAMATELDRCGRAEVLIGRDAPLLREALEGVLPLHFASSMQQAVEIASALADEGDVVLLSPACASFDMFRNYADRGEAFARAVNALGARGREG